MSPFIDQMRGRFGVAPICRVLGSSERSFYAAKTRPLCHRVLTDAEHLIQIRRVHGANYSAYGARRVYKALRRESYKVAKCTVERLMREHGIRGVVRGKPHFTTHPDEGAQRAADLVERGFVASGPNELWVSDITYAKTAQGFIYVCFIEDVFSRRIVGWQLSDHLRAEFVLDALEMALWSREVQAGSLVAHSDRGSQTGLNRSDPSAMRSITRWPSRSTAPTSGSSSSKGGGRPGASWSSRPSSGSAGTTTYAFTVRSGTFPLPSTRPSGVAIRRSLSSRDPSSEHCMEPGGTHFRYSAISSRVISRSPAYSATRREKKMRSRVSGVRVDCSPR